MPAGPHRRFRWHHSVTPLNASAVIPSATDEFASHHGSAASTTYFLTNVGSPRTSTVAPAAPSTYDPAKSPFGGLAHFKPLAAAIPPLRVTYSCATGFEFAYSTRRPVICLALGGPGTQVDQRSGIALPAHNPQQVIRDAAQAMRRFAEDDLLLRNTGESARNVVLSEYLLERRVRQLAEAFTVLVSKQPKSGY